LQVRDGEDATTPADFEAHPVAGSRPEVIEAQISQLIAEKSTAAPLVRAQAKK
jgi:hypothetical protein